MEIAVTLLQVVILVAMAATFSGLNISLMSLPLGDLERRAKLGNARAKRVLPLRRDAYLSLSAILFANVAVVSVTTLLLEGQFNGWVAGIATTLLMVVFGEVLPQAIFVRSALRLCAKFAPLIHLAIIVTYPLSKPLSLLLYRLMGNEKRRRLHTRAELGLLINEHKIGAESELDDGEVAIIQNALQLSEKTVKDIMTPIKLVYWLTSEAVLDEHVVDEVVARGYSRVPIFDENLTKCFGVLLAKDMVDIDFDENPVPVLYFPLHSTQLVGSRTALDTMFHKFPKIGSHLIPIERNDRIIGIMTAEDLIEEMLGYEIADEVDHELKRI